MRKIIAMSLLAMALAACKPPSTADAGHSAAADGGKPAPAAKKDLLADVAERNPQYLVGITFPPAAKTHPALAQVVRSYADAARADLAEAVKEAGPNGAGMPYDLSLNFTSLVEEPAVVVIAADGSLYTGGAHGTPLIARFTYLPAEKRLLKAGDLIGDPAGWKVVSDFVRKQLAEAVAARLDEDELGDADRKEVAKQAEEMIKQGTLPDPANFAEFEPLPGTDGKWYGLRFVFPPYQVGPYSDGTQSVEVPLSLIRPYLNPAYAHLFQGG